MCAKVVCAKFQRAPGDGIVSLIMGFGTQSGYQVDLCHEKGFWIFSHHKFVL